MADSLHDSLTDTHRPAQSSPSSLPEAVPRRMNLQDEEMLKILAESRQVEAQGAGSSPQGNWGRGDGQLLPPGLEQHHPITFNHDMTFQTESTSGQNDGPIPAGAEDSALPVLNVQTSPLVREGWSAEDQERKLEEAGREKDVQLQENSAVQQERSSIFGKEDQLPPVQVDIQHEQLPTVQTPSSGTTRTPHTEIPPQITALLGQQTSVPQLQDGHLIRKEESDFSDSAMEDSNSLASTDTGAQSRLATAQPDEGGPPITFAESADAFQQAEHGVEVGIGYSDQDDGYETDSSATSQSLATSARQFIYENGRRYHSYKADVNPYSFPNDDREQDREDLKHAMFLKLFNKTLHFAQVPANGANVLDLGTGTGIWAVDFADLYPSASVLGIDLSPTQTVWVPPNLKFMVDDAEEEWLHPPNHFDLIHTRHTIQAFRDWPKIFERAFTHLRPGGWIECQELDHVPQCEDASMRRDNPMLTYWLNVTAGLKKLGVDFRLAPHLAAMMRAAGFINVTERVFFTPIGPWPRNRALKEVGMYWRAVLMEGVEAIALGPLMRGLGWGREEVEVFIAGVRKAYVEKGVHAFMPFYVVYGQKPPVSDGGGYGY